MATLTCSWIVFHSIVLTHGHLRETSFFTKKETSTYDEEHVNKSTGIWTDQPGSNNASEMRTALIDFFRQFQGQKKNVSIVDLGAGLGHYAKALRDVGFHVECYDGFARESEITKGLCGTLDLSKPITIGTSDWALCLEVGEHVPKPYEATFLDNIARVAAEGVILSWAVPGQSGKGHVNNRPTEYIVDQMRSRHFSLDAEKTRFLREKDYGKNIQFKNIMVFLRVSDSSGLSSGLRFQQQ